MKLEDLRCPDCSSPVITQVTTLEEYGGERPDGIYSYLFQCDECKKIWVEDDIEFPKVKDEDEEPTYL